MDAGGEWVIAGPDDLPLSCHLDHRNALHGSVAADHRVAVGQSLAAAGVTKESFDAGVVDLSDNLVLLIELHNFVAVGE